MKTGFFKRCVVPIIAGTLFLGASVLGINAVGAHPLPIGIGLMGLFALSIGVYYGICRLEFRDGGFVVHPGKKRYCIEDVVSWRVGEDIEAAPGRQRHLELGFGRWYRRYMLFEEDLSSQVFDQVVTSLHEKPKA